MRVWVLGSGSRGNAVLIESAGSRLLVDAGFAAPVLVRRLAAIEIDPSSVDAVVVTHEHTDHVRGTRVMADQYGWTVHASPGTITSTRDLQDCGAIPFTMGEVVNVGEIDFTAVRSSHDAAEPVVIVATDRRSGARAGVVYDLGCVTRDIAAAVHDLDILVLESNHDELMLHNGPYPPSVRARIASRTGHLSNRRASQLAREVVHRGLRHIILAHVSESCNLPNVALKETSQALAGSRFAGRITVAPQDSIIGPFEPGVRRPAATQLDLGL